MSSNVSPSCTTPYLTVDDALFVALIIGKRETTSQNRYSNLTFPSGSKKESYIERGNISTIVTCTVEEWNNREVQQGKQSKGELFPDVIIDGQKEIGVFMENYEFDYASIGTMTYFPRHWPGILSLNYENPKEFHYETSEQIGHTCDIDLSIRSGEITRQVWTNSEHMNEEIRLRASNPDYLVTKIQSREEKERQLNEYNLELKKYNLALEAHSDVQDDPAVVRRGIDGAVVIPHLPIIPAPPIPPPPERSLTIPPWRVPVQVLIARKTNPPLAPRGRTDGFK